MGFENIEKQNKEVLRKGFEDQTSKEGLEEKMAIQRIMIGKIVEGSGMTDKDIALWIKENGEAMSYLLAEESEFVEDFVDGKTDKKDFIKKLEEVKELIKNRTIH